MNCGENRKNIQFISLFLQDKLTYPVGRTCKEWEIFNSVSFKFILSSKYESHSPPDSSDGTVNTPAKTLTVSTVYRCQKLPQSFPFSIKSIRTINPCKIKNSTKINIKEKNAT